MPILLSRASLISRKLWFGLTVEIIKGLIFNIFDLSSFLACFNRIAIFEYLQLGVTSNLKLHSPGLTAVISLSLLLIFVIIMLPDGSFASLKSLPEIIGWVYPLILIFIPSTTQICWVNKDWNVNGKLITVWFVQYSPSYKFPITKSENINGWAEPLLPTAKPFLVDSHFVSGHDSWAPTYVLWTV